MRYCSVVKTKVGLAFLWDTDLEELTLHSYHRPPLQDGVKGLYWNGSCYKAISAEVMSKLRPIVRAVSDDPDKHSDSLVIPEDLETLVSVPLVSSGRALGALTLGFGETESVQPHEIELRSAIGQQIGMAIENARLYQAAEQVAERLTLLHQISTVLTCTLDAHKLYDQIVEQSVKVLNCQVACILEWNENEQQ